MNLGDASLRFVNSSRPQLIHTTSSRRSVTASDDYYSLVSNESNSSTEKVLKYQTPPSQMRSADASRDALQSASITPPARSILRDQLSHNAKPATVSFGEGQPTKSRSMTADGLTAQRLANCEISPPTPGLDDTPYIQFAIEQLTRDEELLGQRRQGAASEDSYPLRRINPEDDMSYRSTGHERQPSGLEIKHPDSPRK